ncbi:DNA-binding protein [Salipiger sp. PrR003]|uniref:DNA-binding protein n=1 Tax=Salipiger sp. PrR003 TaxID=2706776 RepID=UPI0013DBE6C1|nr:DNA-binding protein [Salipiger sp. PrR003]NDV52174.1 DNA-binding protein [Salipiger sp. PrR003]NDV52200.1 DNA-binding protein [Salipiger sp. PrR003]
MADSKPNDTPPLDRWRFDALVAGAEKLWGLEAIARALNVSVDKARRLAREPSVPIYRPIGAGSYFAFRSELDAWLHGESFRRSQRSAAK